jgi:hypothetical protein
MSWKVGGLYPQTPEGGIVKKAYKQVIAMV